MVTAEQFLTQEDNTPKSAEDFLGDVSPRPQYNYIEPENDGEEESIYIQSSGETINGPRGTGQFFAEIENDDVFDAPVGVLEETGAQFEKQAAYVAMFAHAYGMVGANDVADFYADRSRALAHAQKNQPEYMQEFNRRFENANGFFETAGVILGSPRAIGRVAITQSPNSIMPLMTTYLGAKTGAAVGAGSAAIGGQLGPQAAVPEEVVTVPAAAAVGAVAGGALGSIPGGALVEIGAEIDRYMQEAGVDVTDANDIRRALADQEFMDSVRIAAEKKGITTATVDALFQTFGGRLLKALPDGSGVVKKAAAGAGDVAVQSVGEGVGEAAGQYAAEGKIDYKDAALESVSALAQSVGQTGIAYSVDGGVRAANKLNEKIKSSKDIIDSDAEDIFPGDMPLAKDGLATEDQAFSFESVTPEVKDTAKNFSVDIDVLSPEAKQRFTESFYKIKQLAPDVMENIKAQLGEGFLKLPRAKPMTLSKFLISKGGLKTDTGEAKRYTRKETPQLKGVAKRTGTLDADTAREMAVEAGFIMDYSDPNQPAISTTEDLFQALENEANGIMVVQPQDVGLALEIDTINDFNSALDQARQEQGVQNSITGLKQAFKKGMSVAKKDVKAAQEAVITALENAKLEAADRAKFMRSIKNIDSAEKALKNMPKIRDRAMKLLDASLRRDTLNKINKAVKAAGKSNVMAVDYARRIEDLIKGIDTKNRRDDTMQKLRETREYFEKNPSETAPKRVLKRLEILDKKPLEEVTTNELMGILKEIRRLQEVGKTKQALKDQAKRRLKARRLDELSSSVKPIISTPMAARSIGENVTVLDSLKNTYANFANKARNVSLALNPMDVMFDMLDNGADYQGPAHKIFKQTIDNAFQKYQDRKESITREVKDFADANKLKGGNFERIGVYAAAQQEGGMQKLLATGLTEDQINAVVLTKPEADFYQMMREKLDSMFPDINRVMIEVYNKDVAQVEDYFPFMTDFEAMNDLTIEDTLGDKLPAPTPEAAIRRGKKDVEKGFTKERKGGDQVIKLDAMNVFLQHVDNAAYLIEMAPDIKSLGDVAQTTEFADIAGDVGQRIVVDWIDLLARKGRAPNRVRALDIFRMNTGAAILGYKLSTVLIQPTALLDGMALVGSSYVTRGMQGVAASRQWRQFLKDNFSEIRERVGDDPAYLEMGGKTTIAKVREAGFYALQKVDVLIASSVTAGAYIRAVESRGGKVDLTKADPDAVREAQLYLRRTQSSAFAKDAPMVISSGKMTGNASLDKLIFQFQSFMLNRWSIIKHDVATIGIARGKTAQAINGATFLLLAMAAEIGVRRLSKEMIAALGETDLEPWEETLDEEMIRTAIGQVPIVGSLAGSMEFGSNPVPAISLVDNIIKRAQWAAASKDEDKQLKHSASAAIIAAGTLFGIPGTLQLEQLVRTALAEEKGKGSF